MSTKSKPTKRRSTPRDATTSHAAARPPRHQADRDRLEVVLLESVHPAAARLLESHGFDVATRKGAAEGDALRRVLKRADAIGMRSRTSLGAADVETAACLQAIGCFSVGVNNVDLEAATCAGIPVFNAPLASTRSVAELAVGLVIALARGIVAKSRAAAEGRWDKRASGAHEVRGKTLGIVGYGHVGSQVSVLAEALGMRVVFHDVRDVQPLGNAHALPSLDAVLETADFLTLHVPGGEGTDRLIGRAQLDRMRRGAYLVNTSRGSVVVESAVRRALDSGRLAGAALDVFETEPTSSDEALEDDIARRLDVIVTPHVGGSTEEAQRRIGEQVARRLARYLEEGSTRGAVNFPQVELPRVAGTHRLTHVHRNVPGVMSSVNGLLGRLGANVEAQYLKTQELIGYLIVDLDKEVSREALEALQSLPETIRARLLF